MKRFLLLSVLLSGCSAADKAETVAWQPWGDGVFAQAKREKKLVLLDLGAVWCHWCHVMDRETYGNADVQDALADHWVAIHVNQDERPDLANRYEDYGWPATILFDADGRELGKFRGFMPPERMLSILEAFVADPTPGPSASGPPVPVAAQSPALSKDLDDRLHAAWEAAYDAKFGGWGNVHKYLDPDCVELAIAEGRDDLARGTLDAALQLIDPVWGGVYQYSDGGVWTNPHFEKIMQFQAEDMRIYSLAYRVYGDAKYLKAAKDIERYVMTFLRSPDGAFYASQDADVVPGEHSGGYFGLDDAGRRAAGIPMVDTHCYSRENGWAATGLASMAHATGDKNTLESARLASIWTLRRRGLAPGGFRHDEVDGTGPFLADAVAQLRADLELLQSDQERSWLTCAGETRDFIDRKFRADAGFATAATNAGRFAPLPQVDENIALARSAIRFFHLTAAREWKSVAEHAMKYLAGVAKDAGGIRAAGILLAARELAAEPLKITVVGDADDPQTAALLLAARRAPAAYLVVQRLDPGASNEYTLDQRQPTAYACTDVSCKGPFHDPEALLKACSVPRRR